MGVWLYQHHFFKDYPFSIKLSTAFAETSYLCMSGSNSGVCFFFPLICLYLDKSQSVLIIVAL